MLSDLAKCMSELSVATNKIISPDKAYDRPEIPISYGENKIFKLKSHLQEHVETVHENLTPFQCNNCNKSFGRKGALKYHLNNVHDEIKLFQLEFISNINYNLNVPIT